MEKIKIGILGASGIGRFHAREFNNLGCEVTAILGSSKKSSKKTAQNLSKSFNINPKPYYRLEKILEQDLDAVSICSPQEFHEQQTRKCLDHNLHVLCEKPFVFNSFYQNSEKAEELLKYANEKNKVLTVNTQWPSITKYLAKYTDLNHIKDLKIHMTAINKGVDMLSDHLPHTNSVLIKLIPKGKPENITLPIKDNEQANIKFDYISEFGDCKVNFYLKFKKERPMNVIFSINNEKFTRTIGENYQQKFIHEKENFNIEDPLKISIGRFVDAIKRQGDPLISQNEVLENMKIQDLIIKEYMGNSF